ncbi:MAG: hypothetical protein GWO19_22440 [Nitrospinaceae bacterium]|nr:hypothetical protein [Nitrospinaceae bacterium]NIR56930.1 hypothetical protein [Nitrospinaceae bacterium]NIU98619.1 hypothetical protein [Nitrospinaceae bacterium]NIW07984.1 hypothetical protein [Nitrospinaceae bacterium]
MKLLEEFMTAVRRKHDLGNIPASATLTDIVKKCDSIYCEKFARHYAAAIYKDHRLAREDIAELKELLKLIKKA